MNINANKSFRQKSRYYNVRLIELLKVNDILFLIHPKINKSNLQGKKIKRNKHQFSVSKFYEYFLILLHL